MLFSKYTSKNRKNMCSQNYFGLPESFIESFSCFIASCLVLTMFCFSHVCGQAETQSDAEDGIKFMQEMIELAKQRNDESGMKAFFKI